MFTIGVSLACPNPLGSWGQGSKLLDMFTIGVSLAVALIIGLFRWQRNDSPSHFGGLSNLSSCWPDKHFAPPPVPASFAPAFVPSTSNPILVVVKGSALAN